MSGNLCKVDCQVETLESLHLQYVQHLAVLFTSSLFSPKSLFPRERDVTALKGQALFLTVRFCRMTKKIVWE